MPRFTALLADTGFDPLASFLIVGEGKSSFVVLHEAEGASLQYDPRKLEVREVTRQQASRVANMLRAQFVMWGLLHEESTKTYLGAMHGAVSFGRQIRLIGITGKSRGESRVRVAHHGHETSLEVAVLPQLTYTVAFRFVQHLNASGSLVRRTKWAPTDARWLLSKLNWCFGPQANVTFELVDADWANVPRALGDLLGIRAFETHIVQHKHPSADLTIFFVGDPWTGINGRAGGTWFPEQQVCAVADKGSDVVVARADPFLVSFAHETAHFLRHQNDLVGHHDRARVLLSRGYQSMMLDRELVKSINPPVA